MSSDFQKAILTGIPGELPPIRPYDDSVSHAPVRKEILSEEEKILAVKNALRYFDPKHHAVLAPEFAGELKRYGRIYMYRFRPAYAMHARPIGEYPCKSLQAAAIMLMIQNNLDPAVAQHPHELITYGGNGAVFQNWAQYTLTMKYLAEITGNQTLVMYSGHPMGVFPSHPEAPRVVVTNGMMIPNYSKPDDWERFNALGVTQYGQMTAGSYMYIGPQGIVHGTTITIMNAARRQAGPLDVGRGTWDVGRGAKDVGRGTWDVGRETKDVGRGTNIEQRTTNIEQRTSGKIFVSSGLGGMSGAQAKAAVIAGAVGVIAEVNEKAVQKRHAQGWVDEVYKTAEETIARMIDAQCALEAVSIAYQGNIVDLWEALAEKKIRVELGSDQTSLHNPWSGGYYPAGLTFEQSNELMVKNPPKFREAVQASLRRQVAAINQLTGHGMYFFDYGNAFLLESGRAGAEIFRPDGRFRYPSYVQDIMGPLFFDYGFGPFRWVCTSGKPEDLAVSDGIAARVLEEIAAGCPKEIELQMRDNIRWIREAAKNRLVVGSQARILYADCEGRTRIAAAFNDAIRNGKISAPIVLGRDHHDVSGTDSPYRETSNIYDGSAFTADMAVQNVIGDSFRGATWVSIHNGGGVGWGEVINGGFGMLLDGTPEADRRLRSMLYWDVNNGIARRAWARNPEAVSAITRAMDAEPGLKVTLPGLVDEELLDGLF
jgi:urocanate hydratase